MPNLIAYFALIVWPFVAIVLFKRLPVIQATFWTIVGGYLVLPVKVAIDFPLIPPLDKASISATAALFGCIFIKRIKISLIPRSGIERWLVLLLIVMPVITVLNNSEPIYGATGFLAGLTLHDAVSLITNQYLTIVPFILGLQLIKTHEDQLLIFKLLVIAGLAYSLLILFEIRISPQLHTWVYGFFPHNFGQQFRFGGFRAVVFMGHGLIVAMFVAITLGAAALLWKEKINALKLPASVIVVFFVVLLLLCKTVGAFVLGLVLLLAIAWLPVWMIKRIALFIMLVVMLYPILSIMELFPHQQLVEAVGSFDANRAASLAYRFFHEGRMLEHAQDKLYFGWGGWGRYRLSDSVTDGYWIITLGQYGILGFGALFGLAVLSVWRGTRPSRFLNASEQRLMAGHALLVAIIMIDQIPNSSLSIYLWFYIGALLGRANNVNKGLKGAN